MVLLAPRGWPRGYVAADERHGGGVDAVTGRQRRSTIHTDGRRPRRRLLWTSSEEGGAPPAATNEVAGQPRGSLPCAHGREGMSPRKNDEEGKWRPATTLHADSRGWTSLRTSSDGGAQPAAIVFSERTYVRGRNVAVDERRGGWSATPAYSRRRGGGRGMAAAIVSSADDSMQTTCRVCRLGQDHRGEAKQRALPQTRLQDGPGGTLMPRTDPCIQPWGISSRTRPPGGGEAGWSLPRTSAAG